MRRAELTAMARGAARRLRAYAQLARLDRPADLPLLLLPGFWGLWLAAGGTPPPGVIAAFVIGGFALRCAGWVMDDLAEHRRLRAAPDSLVSRGRVPAVEALWLFTALCFIAFVCAVALGRLAVIYAPIAWGALVAFPFVKRYTALAQIHLGLGYAFTIPMAYFALGRLPDRAGWLLFTAEALFATAFATLYALPRARYEAAVGIRSLVQLLGDATRFVVPVLQTCGLLALHYAGLRAGLGEFYRIGLFVAALLLLWQQWLIWRGEGGAGAYRAYLSNIWLGLAVWAGIAFDFMARCPSG